MNNKTTQTSNQSVHEYVDLGLPSRTLWATENIKNADGNELYFAWGETKGYTVEQVRNKEHAFSWYDYKFGHFNALAKYNESDRLVVLEPKDDAATQNWGAEWKIPTNEQFTELLAETDQEWTEVNGVHGMLFTSKKNGNTVFFAAVGNARDGGVCGVGGYGYYWSASSSDLYIYGTWGFSFEDGERGMGNDPRRYGYSVRPVRV